MPRLLYFCSRSTPEEGVEHREQSADGDGASIHSFHDDSHVSRLIDQQLKKEASEKERTSTHSHQVLVLGASASGKTTFMKQMKVKYNKGFDENDINKFREVIFHNMCEGLVSIAIHWHKFKMHFDADMNQLVEESKQELTELWKQCNNKSKNRVDKIPDLIVQLLNRFHENGQLQKLIKNQVDLACNDGFLYFFCERLEQVLNQNFTPTSTDIFHARMVTESITIYRFLVDGYNYQFVDVSGQKSRRMKWLQYFETASTVILFVPIGNYNQNLAESSDTNTLDDSLALFDALVNHSSMSQTAFIIMFNKVDLFRAKLPIHPLNLYLKSYSGDNSEADACRFIKQTFLKIVTSKTQHIKTHFTHATDQDAMSVIIDTVIIAIVQQNLVKAGFMQ